MKVICYSRNMDPLTFYEHQFVAVSYSLARDGPALRGWNKVYVSLRRSESILTDYFRGASSKFNPDRFGAIPLFIQPG